MAPQCSFERTRALAVRGRAETCRALPNAVRLTTWPREDPTFEKAARALLRGGAIRPTDLEAGLRGDYPLVRVVYGITEDGVSRWYAYRDGQLIAHDSP
jgi:hypothetical protein